MTDTYSMHIRARTEGAAEQEYQKWLHEQEAVETAAVEEERRKQRALETPPMPGTMPVMETVPPPSPDTADAPAPGGGGGAPKAAGDAAGGGNIVPVPTSADVILASHAMLSEKQTHAPLWTVEKSSPQGFTDMVWAATKDITYGLFVEGLPQWVVGGRLDLLKHLGQSVEDFATTLEKHGPQWMIEAGERDRAGRAAIKDSFRELGVETDISNIIVSKPTTTTGKVIRGLSEFRLAFGPFVNAFKSLGMSGWVASPAAAGMTGFITWANNDENITRTVTDYFPALKNPVTEFLASGPDDSGMEKRLKAAVEGALIGFGVEGAAKVTRVMVEQFKMWRAARNLPGSPRLQQEAREAQQLVDAIQGPARDLPLVEVVPSTKKGVTIKAADHDPGVPGAVLGKGVAEAEAENVARQTMTPGSVGRSAEPELGFQFNWRRWSGDDIDTVMSTMMENNAARLGVARRGTITHERTVKLADDLGMTVDHVANWARGGAKNAEQLYAAGQLMRASRDELLRLAKIAEMPTASVADTYALRHQFMITQAISEKFVGAASEAGRALNALKIANQTGNMQYVTAIRDFMARSGGDPAAKNLAAALIDLETMGASAGAMRAAARRGWWATSGDMAKEAFTAGLLWRPQTHLRNMASDFIAGAQQAYEREAAAAIGKLTGTVGGVVPGEGLSGLYGMIASYKDALRMSWQSLKQGESAWATSVGAAPTSKIDLPTRAISSQRIALERGMNLSEAEQFAQTGMGKTIDFIGAGVTTPFRLLAATDDFFKVAGYSFQVNALAYRTATQNGFTGKALQQEVQRLANDPEDWIRQSAISHGNYVTFQNEMGKAGNAFLALRNRTNMPLWYVFPFVKTPANIMTYGFERSPLAYLMGHVRLQIANGGAERDIALARIATGSAIMAVLFDYASSGAITGPGPSGYGEREGWRRAGWQPWSMKIGDNYYSYQSTDPVTMPMAFAAAMAEMVRRKDIDPEKADELGEWIAHSIGAVSLSIIDRSFFHGAQQLVNAIEGSERGTGGVERYLHGMTGSFVPSILDTARRIDDPVMREVNSHWDAVMSKIPVMSRELKPRRDLWGRELEPQHVHGMAYDQFVPWSVSQERENPIDDEMRRLNMSVEPIRNRTSIQGVTMDLSDFPWIKDYLERASGNEMKLIRFNKGTMDALNETVSGRGPEALNYRLGSDGKDGTKARIIKRIVGEGREEAEKQLLAEAPKRFPEFYEKWLTGYRHGFEQKQPVIGGRPAISNPPPPLFPRMQPPLPEYQSR